MLASQSTDVGGEQLGQDFGDLSSMTNFGFQLAASVTDERWSLSFDGTYANLGSNSSKGSVGGFGIGNAADICTDFVYANTFKVSRVVSVSAGFRSFSYDRTDGGGEDAVTTKVKVLGPLIGASFVF